MSLAKEYYQKLEENIKMYGLQVQHVFDNESSPSFSYSIGLFETYKHPEIVIIGLKQELSHILINNMADDIKKGKKYEPLNYYADILDDFDCYIINVNIPEHEEYVFQAIQHYGSSDFQAIQCIYPTVKGIYPWEEAWPEDIKNLQPILGPINKT